MTRRLTSTRPHLRDRWSFDDAAPVALKAREAEAPEAREDVALEARADEALEAREEILPQPPADPAPPKRDFLFTPPAESHAAPASASILHSDAPIVSEATEVHVAPLQPPRQSAGFATASPLPSEWTKIQVSDKARARAAAAGLHRYVEETPAKPRRLMWVGLSAIVLMLAAAAVGLQQFAAAPGTIATQSAETPFPDVSAERPSYIEVPPALPRAEPPARDAPLIEVAP